MSYCVLTTPSLKSYVMRNAVLSVMGELLVQELSESTDDAVKKTRDHYFIGGSKLLCLSGIIIYVI